MYAVPKPSNVREYLAEKVAMVDRQDWYRLLAIEPDADAGVVAEACVRMVRVLADDRFLRADSPELSYAAERARKGVARAQMVLQSPTYRRAYDESRRMQGRKSARGAVRIRLTGDLEPAKPKEVSKDVKRAVDHLHTQVREALSVDAFVVAEALLEKAIRLDSSRSATHLRLACLIIQQTDKLTDSRRQRARRHLEAACTKAPYDAQTRYCMAVFWKHAGILPRYRQELEATLRCDPSHAKALRDIEKIREHKRAELQKERVAVGILSGVMRRVRAVSGS